MIARRLRMIARPEARRSRGSLLGREPSGTDCPAARGQPRRMRAAGAADIEMTTPNALGLLCCGRPQRAADAGVRSEVGSQILAFQH
jgi:hypothetical protein